VNSELFLDDIAMGGEAMCLLMDFLHLEAVGKKVGHELNGSKCEVIGHTIETQAMFTSYGINLLETSASEVILLGIPLLASPHLDSVLERKHLELWRLSHRLERMSSHNCLYLLCNIVIALCMMYLLRTVPCTNSPKLSLYDGILFESLVTNLNIDFDDDRWNQTLLPVRWGGLDIHSVVSLAPSAYMASAASTAELMLSLLPTQLHNVVDSGVATTMSAWIMWASCPSML
jgi:hypothetical protein